jgi:hypothetical protein
MNTCPHTDDVTHHSRPAQIAARFEDQLNDPMYGLENRVRFRDVIDRICLPKAVVDVDGQSVLMTLVLRPEYGGHGALPSLAATPPSNQFANAMLVLRPEYGGHVARFSTEIYTLEGAIGSHTLSRMPLVPMPARLKRAGV